MDRALPKGLRRNRILASLSEDDLALLQPSLVPVELKFRQRLQSANRAIPAVYFIESGLASVVAIGGRERQQTEVAVIGREGMTGGAAALGAIRSPCEIFMQVEGEGQCIDVADFRHRIGENVSFLKAVLLFEHALFVQAAYTGLSNAKGSLEERLARWLLMAQDRLEATELALTHEFLALMLGVRRAGVSIGLQRFEKDGLIEAQRGSISIIDRDGLEEAANGLYGTPEGELERVFPSA
jgi:CRP-like cAMP-binding protein